MRQAIWLVVLITSIGFMGATAATAHHVLITYVPRHQQFLPLLIFDSGEEFFPCAVDFDGDLDPTNNHERYTTSAPPVIYYAVVRRENYTVYEYWIYYAYNPAVNIHEHDLERAYVFVRGGKPVILAASAHHWWNLYRVDRMEDLYLYVEKGGHAMAHVLIGAPEGHQYSVVSNGLGRRIYPDEVELRPLSDFISKEPYLLDPNGYLWTNEAGDLVQGVTVRPDYWEPEMVLTEEFKELLGV